MIGLVCATTMLACVDRQVNDDTSGEGGGTTGTTGTTGGVETAATPTTSGAPDTSEPLPGSTSTGTEPEPGTSGGTVMQTTAGDESCGFLCGDTDSEPLACDVFVQDCPEGQKCAPYAEGGGSSWNASKCVPVTGDGQPGEPCTAQESGVSGLDDCAKGVYCWDVDMMLQGTCVEMCGGSESKPVCTDPDALCSVTSEGVINLCIPDCDPFLQDCPGGDLCIPVADSFVCVFDGSGDEGQVFDPCEFPNMCDKGLICLNPGAASECDPNAVGCCLPLCDLSQPDPMCPGAGQNCVSLYEEGMEPPKFEHVGVCAIPG
jgi:hypothetical protein